MNKVKDSCLMVLLGLATLLICGIVLWLTVVSFMGVSHWWHDVTTTTPAEQAIIDQRDAEYATDPLNPKVIAQKCIDAGGYPKQSSWDGSITCTAKGGGNKNVKIEVNQ